MPAWLVNPGKRRTRDKRGRFSKARKKSKTTTKRGKAMATRRKRDSRGRFLKKGRSSPTTRTRTRTRKRSTAVARRSSSPTKRRKTYRRNPPKMKPLETLIEGTWGALGVTLGKAAARAVPQQLGLPTAGPVGIAVTAATALGLSMVAERVSRKYAPFIVAGALAAPMEQIIRDRNIPILSPALSGYSLAGYSLGTYDPANPDPELLRGGGGGGLAAYARAPGDPFATLN